MSVQGPNFPTAATGNTNTIGGGAIVWTNPQNIGGSDSIFATAALTLVSPISDDLIGTGFGFSLASTDIVNGILLEINYKANSTPRITETHVRLLKAGVAAGSDKSTGATFPLSVTTASYGGSADLWGTTWTATDINNANFGAAFVCTTSGGVATASVDFFRITVTFTHAGIILSQMFQMFF